jgi:hypothetical protein
LLEQLQLNASRLAAAAIAFGIVIGAMPASAEHPEITARRTAERKSFTDAEITQGLFKIAFGAELHVAGRVERIRKYAKPVRVFVDSRAQPDRRGELARVVADIRERVRHLDISVTEDRGAGNVFVALVRDKEIGNTIRELFGGARARRIQRSLEPQCLSGFSKDSNYRIEQSYVILAADVDDFVFIDCAYEELLQSLGPINDDPSVPWTMFNDDVQKGFFGIYDQLLLNILYDPRVRPGATRREVRALLPKILPDVRRWVNQVNGLQ